MVNVNKIKALATEQGRSLAYLCSKMGVAKVYFNDIQKHGRDIPDNRLQTIADILNTTPEYLRDETDIKEKPSAKGEELADDTVIVCRNGKRFIYHLDSDKIEALKPLLDQLKDENDPDF